MPNEKDSLIEKTFGKYAGLAKIILAIVSIALIAYIVWTIYKQIEKNRIKKALEQNSQTATINGTQTTVNIGTKASEIYDALHGSWWSEDEVKAVNAVLSVPKPLIPSLTETYYTISGGINLKQDLQEYLDSSQWISISSQFN